MAQTNRRDQQPATYSYRRDPAVAAFPDDRPILIFDGHCVLCSGFAQLVMRHDHAKRFRLMAAQSPLGQSLYRHLHLDPITLNTMVLLQHRRGWYKSEGAIRMFSQLGLPWSGLRLLRWSLLRPLRPLLRLLDPCYDWVAQNRLRWFGSRATCFVPDRADRDRLLE